MQREHKFRLGQKVYGCTLLCDLCDNKPTVRLRPFEGVVKSIRTTSASSGATKAEAQTSVRYTLTSPEAGTGSVFEEDLLFHSKREAGLDAEKRAARLDHKEFAYITHTWKSILCQLAMSTLAGTVTLLICIWIASGGCNR